MQLIQFFVKQRTENEYIRIKTNTITTSKVHIQTSKNDSSVCLYCKKDKHLIINCRKFLKLKIKDRIKSARELKLCFKCAVAKWKICNCHSNNTLPYHKLLQYPKAAYVPERVPAKTIDKAQVKAPKKEEKSKQ